ncbi:cilia- and flagella-associated protein 100-like isoform X2 [Nerophis lumbriciformis]|uniref:cilia- and flagella-associated protein 100-like isoform X2 n=1 Tax=Nerophis lumbriciformis TaxID=546530 RepID=UPI002ADFD2DF|nr:cilia- and flagella-associated protein 100-like isoform X2 [Nerophis lumbriciformis]
MSSDSVVSKQDGVAKSRKADTRRRKSPDSKSILLQSLNEKSDRQKEMRNFLSLPIHEKTTYSTRMMAEQRKELFKQLKEEESVNMLKQARSKSTLPMQTPARRELKLALLKQTQIVRECKHDFIAMERQKAVLEISLMTKRSEICKMDKAIAKEQRQLRELEKLIEKDNQSFEQFLRDNEKKSMEARTFELSNYEETLQEYKSYKELLLKLSPPDWQEAQKAKVMKKIQLMGNTEDELNKEPMDSMTVKQGVENNRGSARLSPAESTSVSMRLDPDADGSEYEEDPELYFTDPKQLIELMTELTEQNLSLIKNSTRAEETLEELKQSMEAIRKTTEKDEALLTQQMNEMNKRIEEEKARAAKLKQKVQLHVLLNTEDEDDMLSALSEKVAEVYRCCVDNRGSSHSTLEKLASIEKQMSSLLHCLDDIPTESLEMMQKIKDSERRTRQREEKLRMQREKQVERMKRYLERSLSEAKKTSGRKLMPRCLPTAQKVKVKKVESASADDDFNNYFSTSLDIL